MKILVTGATGCLGTCVANYLTNLGHSVTATGRNLQLAKRLSHEVDFIQGDLSNDDFVRTLVQGHDSIVHCAGLSTLWGKAQDFHKQNVLATSNLLRSAIANGVQKFVFISTPSVYFDFKNRLQIKETDYIAAKPVNEYVVTKIKCEQLVSQAHNVGLQTVILRPRAIFGPGDRSLMPRILKLATKGYLPLIDGGHAKIDLTYVENVSHAIALSLDHLPAMSGRIYNISNGEPITASNLFAKLIFQFKLNARCVPISSKIAYTAAAAMEAIATITPGQPEPTLTRYSVGILACDQTLSLQAAQTDLGYKPLVSLEEGIKRTAESFIQSKQTLRKLVGRNA